MSIGMECELYMPEICDWQYCSRNCQRCPWADKVLEELGVD